MHKVFHIESSIVQKLDDTQARELVARLCKAELKKAASSTSAVSWGGDQRAKDGGVDVYVSAIPPVGLAGFVPNDNCGIQVKAEAFPPSKIAPEMEPSGKIRPAIEELSKVNGAYLIISTRDNTSHDALKNRIAAMRQCLAKHKLAQKVFVDFYDSRKIADWVEEHPTIVAWMRSIVGNPLTGWRPYGAWSYNDNDVDAEYILDDRARMFSPNSDDGLSIANAIDRLRTELGSNTSVRIVGLSGVGKTRLVQALFDPRIATSTDALDPENVIYCDLSDTLSPQPSELLEALFAEKSDCVVVIDNCGPDTHQRLTEIAKRAGSQLKLITVEYDIRDDLPEGTSCFRLDGSSKKVTCELVARNFSGLSEVDIDTIAEFSDGNARVAFALASTSNTAGEISRLRDEQLFKRLFNQTNTENEELLRCAQAASLVYSFDFEDVGEQSELATLASLADVGTTTFARNMTLLFRRGLLQARGRWRAVLPHAISNRLASLALEELPTELVTDRLAERSSERLARSFSRRLGYLHESPTAIQIANEWLQPSGRLGNLALLNELGRQMFANIAPIDQEAAMAALERASLNTEFVSVKNRNRSDYANIARSLAYEPQYFERAASVLVRFAEAEPEGYNNNTASEKLCSLFGCQLSGTQASPKQRLAFIERFLNSKLEDERRVGLKLLDAAFEASHFSSIHGFDFGARKRDYGWYPRSRADVKNWYGSFISLAASLGSSSSPVARDARVILGDAIRGCWVNAKMETELVAAVDQLNGSDGWAEGWLGIRRVLHFDGKDLRSNSLVELKRVEKLLSPKDLKQKIEASVLPRGSFAHDYEEIDEDDDEPHSSRYRRAEKNAEELGRALAEQPNLLEELLPKLITKNSNSKSYRFGLGVGSQVADPKALLSDIRSLVASSEDFNVIFLRGVIRAWQQRDPSAVSGFLGDAVVDNVWSKWFAELQLHVDLDSEGCSRLLRSLQKRNTPIWQYSYLGMGRSTDPLTIEQIDELVAGIISADEQGLMVALDILGMVVHCTDEKNIEYKDELAKYLIQFIKGLDWTKVSSDHGRLDHDLEMILNFALSGPVDEDELNAILQNLLQHERSEEASYSYNRGKRLEPFFKHFPRQTLDAVYVPDEDSRYRSTMRLISRQGSSRQETALSYINSAILVDWCDVSPKDRYIFAASTCRLFEKTSESLDGKTIQTLKISETAKHILQKAPDKQGVLDCYLGRVHPMSYSGNLSTILIERMQLLDQLNPKNNQKLQAQIEKAKSHLSQTIAREQEREALYEQERSASFE